MRIICCEHAQISRKRIGAKSIKHLHLIERTHRTLDSSVLGWDETEIIRVQNYVGVIEVPGLSIEILPKHLNLAEVEYQVDSSIPNDTRRTAQRNLLYMLTIAGLLPFEEHDLAALGSAHLSLYEAIMSIFAHRLRREFRRGLDRNYVRMQENLQFLRGKILVNQDIRMNTHRRERVFVEYEDFVCDTPINRIFKYAVQKLLYITRSAETRQLLHESLVELAEVSNVPMQSHQFDNIQLSKNSRRFEPLIKFCQMLLKGLTPVPGSGDTRTFSLLFPMEIVFERFVASFVKIHAHHVGLDPDMINIQGAGNRRWLLRSIDKGNSFQLIPDIVIKNRDGTIRAIWDTKWKKLKLSNFDEQKSGIKREDIYQMYAYTHRYRSPDNLLVYPKSSEIKNKSYLLLDPGMINARIRSVSIDLDFDLLENKQNLIEQFRRFLE